MLISHNSDFITCNCEFISQNSEKKVRIASYKLTIERQNGDIIVI